MIRFWSGFAAGVAASAAAVQAAFVGVAGDEARRTLIEFQSNRLPAITRLVTAFAWAWGAPVITVAAVILVGMFVRHERGRLVVFAALAAAAIAVFVLTYYGTFLPFRMLSDEIRE